MKNVIQVQFSGVIKNTFGSLPASAAFRCPRKISFPAGPRPGPRRKPGSRCAGRRLLEEREDLFPGRKTSPEDLLPLNGKRPPEEQEDPLPRKEILPGTGGRSLSQEGQTGGEKDGEGFRRQRPFHSGKLRKRQRDFSERCTKAPPLSGRICAAGRRKNEKMHKGFLIKSSPVPQRFLIGIRIKTEPAFCRFRKEKASGSLRNLFRIAAQSEGKTRSARVRVPRERTKAKKRGCTHFLGCSHYWLYQSIGFSRHRKGAPGSGKQCIDGCFSNFDLCSLSGEPLRPWEPERLAGCSGLRAFLRKRWKRAAAAAAAMKKHGRPAGPPGRNREAAPS